MQDRSVGLQREQIVAAAGDDPFGDVGLGPDRIDGDERAGQLQSFEQQRNGRHANGSFTSGPAVRCAPIAAIPRGGKKRVQSRQRIPAGDRRRRATIPASRKSAFRKVLKGGSQLCASNYCRRYRLASRHAKAGGHVDQSRPVCSANTQETTPLTGRIAGKPIHPAAPTGARTPEGVEALALHWFARMRAGEIDRSQLAPEYEAHLTDQAVEEMSRYLRAYEFGALPLEAHVLQTRESGPQTLHVVKIVFPRGDAASLMMGFNADGKITGISLMSMAGD